MVKLTNREASGFISPVISELFSSKERRFPVTDAFKIAELIADIQTKMKVHQDQTKRIIESHNGKIQSDGRVLYKDLFDQQECTKKLDELNEIEITIQGDKVKRSDQWPDLTIQEAFLLKPIIAD